MLGVGQLGVKSHDSLVQEVVVILRHASRGVPIWEFWVLPIPIIFLSESTDTDH